LGPKTMRAMTRIRINSGMPKLPNIYSTCLESIDLPPEIYAPHHL
jgi:hypothetical protein